MIDPFIWSFIWSIHLYDRSIHMIDPFIWSNLTTNHHFSKNLVQKSLFLTIYDLVGESDVQKKGKKTKNNCEATATTEPRLGSNKNTRIFVKVWILTFSNKSRFRFNEWGKLKPHPIGYHLTIPFNWNEPKIKKSNFLLIPYWFPYSALGGWPIQPFGKKVQIQIQTSEPFRPAWSPKSRLCASLA